MLTRNNKKHNSIILCSLIFSHLPSYTKSELKLLNGHSLGQGAYLIDNKASIITVECKLTPTC